MFCKMPPLSRSAAESAFLTYDGPPPLFLTCVSWIGFHEAVHGTPDMVADHDDIISHAILDDCKYNDSPRVFGFSEEGPIYQVMISTLLLAEHYVLTEGIYVPIEYRNTISLAEMEAFIKLSLADKKAKIADGRFVL